jgi:hypothetical protein
MRTSGALALGHTVVLLMTAGTVCQATANAQTDSIRRDTTAGGAGATTANPPTTRSEARPLSMPAELRGYRIADSARLAGDYPGMVYTYAHDKHDKIQVFVSTYQDATALRTTDDTVALLEGDVDQLRQSLDGAFRRGDLTAFQSMREHPDDLATGGRTVRGYMMFAALTHRGAGTAQINDPMSCSPGEMAQNSGNCPRRSRFPQSSDAVATDRPASDVRGFQAYTYYGVYALPQYVIRVRAELPQQTAINEGVTAFAHQMVASLIAAH